MRKSLSSVVEPAQGVENKDKLVKVEFFEKENRRFPRYEKAQ